MTLPTNEELLASRWMRFEYHKTTREAFVMMPAPGGLLSFQTRKDGQCEQGFRTFKPSKMVMIEDCDPDWDHLPQEWQPLLEKLR